MNDLKIPMTLGLLGYPIKHSLSPIIHNNSARLLKKKNVYKLHEIHPDHLDNFLQKFWDEGGLGLNITSPYKQIIASKIQKGSIYPINTVYRGERGWLSCSTDGEGFVRSLNRSHTPITKYKKIYILGSGGVVYSILSHIIHKISNTDIYIFRRSKRNDLLLDLQNNKGNTITLRNFDKDIITKTITKNTSKNTLLIQATNAHYQGDDLSKLSCILENFKGVFYELNYGKTSSLLSIARRKKIKTFDGLIMLIEQALLSQKYWWGVSADFLTIERILKKHLFTK